MTKMSQDQIIHKAGIIKARHYWQEMIDTCERENLIPALIIGIQEDGRPTGIALPFIEPETSALIVSELVRMAKNGIEAQAIYPLKTPR